MDCGPWSIPAWEMRLRRRLWWALYSEVTWRSLLLGLPSPISEGYWDVITLGDDDFTLDHLQCPDEETATQAPALQRPCVFCHDGHDFRFHAQLAIVAKDVGKLLYSLSVTKDLAKHPSTDMRTCHGLLGALHDWRSKLPPRMAIEHVSIHARRDYFHAGSSSHLKLASLTVEIYIYRSLLRSITEAVSLHRHSSSSSSENITCSHPELEPELVQVFQASVALVERASNFAQSLTTYDLNSLCFSCKWSTKFEF